MAERRNCLRRLLDWFRDKLDSRTDDIDFPFQPLKILPVVMTGPDGVKFEVNFHKRTYFALILNDPRLKKPSNIFRFLHCPIQLAPSAQSRTQ